MDTPRGRQTFVDFFTNYHVPEVPGLAAGLGRIGCPTAIIPVATLIQLTGGDHYIMEERPDEVTAALLELLARPCVVSPGAGIRRYPR